MWLYLRASVYVQLRAVGLFGLVQAKPIDNKPGHWVLPPGHWRLKQKICRLFQTIWIYHNHYLPCTYNSKRCRRVCNCYCYDRAVHISVAVDMRTLLDRNSFSSSSNGHVAAHRVTGLIIKRLWYRRGRWRSHSQPAPVLVVMKTAWTIREWCRRSSSRRRR